MRYETYNPNRHGEPLRPGRKPTRADFWTEMFDRATKEPVVVYDVTRGHIHQSAQRYGYAVRTKALPGGGRVVWAHKLVQDEQEERDEV